MVVVGHTGQISQCGQMVTGGQVTTGGHTTVPFVSVRFKAAPISKAKAMLKKQTD